LFIHNTEGIQYPNQMGFDMRTDPIELIIESALNAAGIENHEAHDVGLDFYLPSLWRLH